jgi:hypothetical protein
MKVGLSVMLAALFCSCISGCKTVRYMKDISQVSYTSESGTILPELQWYEQIVITSNKVTLIRNGKTTNTEINAGTWEFAVDEQKVTAFFEQLEPSTAPPSRKLSQMSPQRAAVTRPTVLSMRATRRFT